MIAHVHHAAGLVIAWAGTAAMAATTVLATVDTTQVTVAGIGAAGTVTTALLVAAQSRSRARVDDTHRLVDQLQDQLATEIAQAAKDRAEYSARANDLERRLTDVNLGVAKLIGQLQAHGITPVWQPQP